MQWLTRKKAEKSCLNRIRRIKGQIEALESVLQKESSDDCSAVLQQIASIRGLWEWLMMTVLEGHIRRAYRRRKGIARPEAGGYRTGHIGVALLCEVVCGLRKYRNGLSFQVKHGGKAVTG